MKTILVANRKGGCGKTIVAITLAAALAGRGAARGARRRRPAEVGLALAQAPPGGRRADPRPSTGPTAALGDAPKKLDWLVIDAPGALTGGRADAAGRGGGGGDDASAAFVVRRRFDRAVPQGDRAPEAGAQGEGRGASHRQPGACRRGQRCGSRGSSASWGKSPWPGSASGRPTPSWPSRVSRSSTSRSGPTCRSGRSGSRCWRSWDRGKLMDLGIRGRTAIVCAASKGLGRGCAEALAAEGVDLVDQRPRRRRARGDRGGDARRRTGCGSLRSPADITSAAGRAAVLAAAPASGHPRHQRRRAAARALVGLEPRGFPQGDRRQHADADRADAGGDAGDDRARLGPGGQHHLGGGEGADRAARPLEYCPGGADRLRRRDQPAGGGAGGRRSTTCCRASTTPTGRMALDSAVVKARGIDMEAARAAAGGDDPGRRYGTPEEFGAACAFLCSVHAGLHRRAELGHRRRGDKQRPSEDAGSRSRFRCRHRAIFTPPGWPNLGFACASGRPY